MKVEHKTLSLHFVAPFPLLDFLFRFSIIFFFFLFLCSVGCIFSSFLHSVCAAVSV